MTFQELLKCCKLKDSTVLATQAIANVVKSSFGPSGLDKMMVDDIGVSYAAAQSSG
jgi:chaperonin GroEL (HSP60 family)